MVCQATMVHTLFVALTSCQLKPGQSLELKGYIPRNTRFFTVDMGINPYNLALHFNPRFNYYFYYRKTVLNSMQGGVWGPEKTVNTFPFWEETETTVCFTLRHDKITACFDSGEKLEFSLRFPIQEISYASVSNIYLKSHRVLNRCSACA
ncbi:galectin-1-like isoform X1 [Hyperolius riggenbachi]|uniref:galectin-1-like isoform X1 n=1 Tax=Hyperolius riggenbachi TaxID=752182 RepID=UPI0035A28DC2